MLGLSIFDLTTRWVCLLHMFGYIDKAECFFICEKIVMKKPLGASCGNLQQFKVVI